MIQKFITGKPHNWNFVFIIIIFGSTLLNFNSTMDKSKQNLETNTQACFFSHRINEENTAKSEFHKHSWPV